jgi:DNA invertase Pin-like site-specific DNA recombinase
LSFAEFERDMIVQRTMEGKAIAKERPDYREGRPRIEVDLTEQYNAVQRGDKTVTEACKMLGISRSTWYDRVRSM